MNKKEYVKRVCRAAIMPFLIPVLFLAMSIYAILTFPFILVISVIRAILDTDGRLSGKLAKNASKVLDFLLYPLYLERK